MKRLLHFLDEPEIIFGYNQSANDPRDGLSLFGPHETFTAYTMQVGVIGTIQGVELYKNFASNLQKPILSDDMKRPSYLGFETIFGVKWERDPLITCILDENIIDHFLKFPDRNERTYKLVSYFIEKLSRAEREEEKRVDIWFVVIPRDIWKYCRPNSEHKNEVNNEIRLFRDGNVPLFDEIREEIEEKSRFYDAQPQFHNQLKARLIQENIHTPTQIILEPTLQFKERYRLKDYSIGMQAHLAWTISSTLYYKLGKLPWKLSAVREGVCYVGLVFKKYTTSQNNSYACSAAQMFLDSGDGTVFRGNIGPWKSPNSGDFHLDAESANDLLSKALVTYYAKHNKYPVEMFIHGKAHFTDDEWEGFSNAISQLKAETKLVGVIIQETSKLKIFRDVADESSNYGNLRGLMFIESDRSGYLWTSGFVPKLNTSTSLEIPNPLRIRVARGFAEIEQVLKDVLALTKLNYNACIYGDGLPVTLRFSDDIGSILTAIDNIDVEVLPFKYYI